MFYIKFFLTLLMTFEVIYVYAALCGRKYNCENLHTKYTFYDWRIKGTECCEKYNWSTEETKCIHTNILHETVFKKNAALWTTF